MTQTEYNQRMAQINQQLDDVCALLAGAEDGKIELHPDTWDWLNDLQDELESAADDLDFEQYTEDWTWQDWQDHELVINNID